MRLSACSGTFLPIHRPYAGNLATGSLAAAKTWRRLKGENQLPKVVGGVTFRNGVEIVNAPAKNVA